MEQRLRAFLRRLDSLPAAGGSGDPVTQEFQSIKSTPALGSDVPELSAQAGKLKENLKKNRYKDILPFDQTRVPLTLLTEDGYSDYINANFIRGVDGRQTYIATQGPLGNTVVDLWRMIWEFRVTVVVMVCKEVELGKRKCERYWATEQEPVTFGPFTISNVGEESLGSEVITRTLSVNLHGDVRTVQQFQYLAWPDHGIPGNVDGLLGMIERLHRDWDEEGGPVCIHCSAGCGRTGVLCTVDYVRNLLLNQLVSEDFSILDIVREMRRQRPAAVQTKDQYHFVYRIVGEMFLRRLEAQTPDDRNRRERVQTRPEEQPLPVSKPLPRPKPRRLPRPQGQPSADSMSGGVGDTYAVVSRPRSGQPAPGPGSARGGEDEGAYQNLQGVRGDTPPPPGRCVYTAVQLPGDGVRTPEPPNVSSHPRRAGEGLHYTTLTFGTPPPHTPADWAPSLPQRTANSFMVDDQARDTEQNVDDGYEDVSDLTRVTGLARDTEQKVDDGYEDVSDLTRVTGLGFNARIPKPKGPRDPPSEWAQYGR